MNVLPQPCQATGKKTVGLLGGVLADQLQLPQGWRDLVAGHCRQAGEQFFRAFEAQASDRHLKVFAGLGQAAVGVAVGLANDAQGQGRAVLHQLGDIAQ
ncbi:hypothetical protein D3C71_1766770 [compost metagenome]